MKATLILQSEINSGIRVMRSEIEAPANTGSAFVHQVAMHVDQNDILLHSTWLRHCCAIVSITMVPVERN